MHNWCFNHVSLVLHNDKINRIKKGFKFERTSVFGKSGGMVEGGLLGESTGEVTKQMQMAQNSEAKNQGMEEIL